MHPAALTKLSLNRRCARHHVWSPLLHSGWRAFPEPEGRPAAPSGGQSRGSRHAVWGRARPGSLGGHPHRVPPELRGRHDGPRPAPPLPGSCQPSVGKNGWRGIHSFSKMVTHRLGLPLVPSPATCSRRASRFRRDGQELGGSGPAFPVL